MDETAEKDQLISDENVQNGARSSQHNVLTEGDSSAEDDVVIVPKNTPPDEIEDKPLTIDMTPKLEEEQQTINNGDAQLPLKENEETGSIQSYDEELANKNKESQEMELEESKPEKQSLLDVELKEGKPTTVRGEKKQAKERKKQAKHDAKQAKHDAKQAKRDLKHDTKQHGSKHDSKHESKQESNNNSPEKNALLNDENDDNTDDKITVSTHVTPGGDLNDENENNGETGELDDFDEEPSNVVEINDTFLAKIHKFFSGLYESGALLSIVFTLILWGLFVWMAIEHNVESIICFVVMYIIYIIECYVSKTYLEILKAEVSDTVSAKVLDALKEAAPSIHWHIDCYHIETTYSVTNENKKVILWLYGKSEDCYVLKKAGYRVECFQSEWTIINYMSDPLNYPKIAAIILPIGQVVGYSQLQKSIAKKYKEARLNAVNVTTNTVDQTTSNSGSKTNLSANNSNSNSNSNNGGNKKASNVTSKAAMDSGATAEEVESMNKKKRGNSDSSSGNNGNSSNGSHHHNYDDDTMPVFLKWHEKKHDRMSLLLKDCVHGDILKKTRRELTTHSSDAIYKFKHWNDISEDLPEWKSAITNLTIEKSYVLKDRETRIDYNKQKSLFQNSESNNCDEHQKFDERLKIRGWRNTMLIKRGNHDNSGVPWWMSKIGFWIISILMFSIISRLKVYSVKDVTWKLIKQVSV